MTHEAAEQMRGPTGRVARRLTDEVLVEFDKWAQSPSNDTVYDVRTDLLDFLPITLSTVLTELQLTGVLTISDDDCGRSDR